MPAKNTPGETTLALADLAVITVLHKAGKRLIKSPRSRVAEIRESHPGVAMDAVYMVYPAEPLVAAQIVSGELAPFRRAAQNAGSGPSADRLSQRIEEYLVALLVTGAPHRVEHLRTRLGA